jgi:hypothetical protein
MSPNAWRSALVAGLGLWILLWLGYMAFQGISHDEGEHAREVQEQMK